MTNPSTPPTGAGRALPTGTVTFLFTDIEGSTKLAQAYPNEMPVLLARHHEILHQSIEAHNGYVFQIVGDSFAAAFHSAIDALNAAVDAQRLLHNESWTPASVKVRMGIHTSTAQLNDASAPTVYTGYATLALTQRIMSAGHGGQVLLSGATRELVRDSLPEATELIDLGEKRLKDLFRPEHLYQLNITGLPSAFPPLKTLDSFPNNLPTQLTTFIGREKEIAEVKHELEEHRLVTLTGSGGTGKTRLSLQVAAELLEKFEHGAWFIELAPLTDPDLIPQTILSAIGISEQPNKLPIEILKEYLHEKKVLIVLDNCEHLVAASAQVANTLLNAAPRLKVMASSREALGVKGEVSYPVPSLTLPDIKHLPVIEQLSQYEAVRLFIDRALLVSPHFVVDKDNAPFIAQICHRLDGIPLAIELAAARVKMMSVEQISKRLDDRFRLLTGGARTALPRQQTLRALIDWSYDHLSENEQILFRRLSVFMGGWALEAAEEVCSDSDHAKRSVNSDAPTDYRLLITDILDLLTQLVNKSLVVVVGNSRCGETRYRMLETIRQYAREKLLEVGGGEIIRRQHLAYFVKLAKQAEPELYRSNQVFWLNKLDDELDNIRAAMDWALATDVESGLRLIIVPRLFWEEHGNIQEIGGWLAQLLEQYNNADSLRAPALAAYSYILAVSGDLKLAENTANQSLELSRAISDKHAEALCLLYLGVVISVQGNYREGIPFVEQSLALYQSLGDWLGQATATMLLSIKINDLERSKALVLESLKLFRELGHLSGIADCLGTLAIQTIWGGDFSSPVKWLEEARTIYRQLKTPAGEATILQYYGILAYWRGDYQQACEYYKESSVLYESVGNTIEASWVGVHTAYARLRQGELTRAREMFEERAQYALGSGNIDLVIFALEGSASLYVKQGGFERAARLFAWTNAKREAMDNPNPPVEKASIERDLAIIHSKLDDAEFAELSTNGRTMTTEQAIALALED